MRTCLAAALEVFVSADASEAAHLALHAYILGIHNLKLR